MKLNSQQIKKIIFGAIRIEEDNGLIKPLRFTSEQQEYYNNTREDFYLKTFTSAGMKLEFKTDSKTLFLDVLTGKPITRSYFSYDIFVDGEMIGNIDNYSNVELPEPYTIAELPTGEYSKEFLLGDGMKRVTIYLPWSVSTSIKEISLDDGAKFIPTEKPRKKIIAWGDSITQGYDALRPSNRYMSRLADKIGAEEFSKAIGGEKFAPELIRLQDDLNPDYVIVAYGTNDWCVYDEETVTANCREFYKIVSNKYPNAKIFAITPIWRKDLLEENECGPFENIEKIIRDATDSLNNVTVIKGFDFVPKHEKYYADYRLHPNDDGFGYYADSLYEAIKDML